MLRSFVVLRMRRRLILAVRSVCLVLVPPAPTNVQLASSPGASGHVGNARRMGSFGGAVQQACSAGVKLAGARAAGTGRRAKRAEARG